MMVEVNGRNIETDVQGFLQHMEEWSEDFAKRIADRDDIKLYNDHWELIYYFREYYEEHMTNPTMHMLVKELGPKNKSHHEQKAYEKHIYGLFPRDPVHEVCKLAGLPLPQPDD
jgi:tRNA 2-thiouridine synthesizing protein E